MNILKYFLKKHKISKGDLYYYGDGRLYMIIDIDKFSVLLIDDYGQAFLYNIKLFEKLVTEGIYKLKK